MSCGRNKKTHGFIQKFRLIFFFKKWHFEFMMKISTIVKKVSELNLTGFSVKEISEMVNISEVEVYRVLSGSNSPIPRGPSLQAYKEKSNKDRFP